jgi:uncharacterized membrane protein YfcA
MMRVAILGTRGIPACYSGFETLAEELGARLVQHVSTQGFQKIFAFVLVGLAAYLFFKK